MFKPALRFRKQLLIDHQVQIPILKRMGFYMLACVVYFMVVLGWAESTSYGHESFSRTLTLCFDVMICWAPGVMLLAPIIAYDVLVFTNKFAGPMFRLRREMQNLIDGQSTNPIQLRTDDCWPEMADLFNEIRAELIELRAATSPKTKVLFDPNKANTEEILINDDSVANEHKSITAEQQPAETPEVTESEAETPSVDDGTDQDGAPVETAAEQADSEPRAAEAQDADSDDASGVQPEPQIDEEQLATAE